MGEGVTGARYVRVRYDASYVAAAELIDAPLATLDQKLANTPVTRCDFLVPG